MERKTLKRRGKSRHRQFSVLRPDARKQSETGSHGEKTRLLPKDKGFPEKYEQLLKRHYVGAELGRQRGRKAFSPGGEKSLKLNY